MHTSMIRKLNETARERSMIFFRSAEHIAQQSLCLRAKCGAIIVDMNDNIIGMGYNAPPNNKPLKKCRKDEIKEAIIMSINEGNPIKIDNTTCCIHAEENAIIHALENKPDLCMTKEELFEGSRLYYVRIADNGKMIPSGRPWCTRCSTLALGVGISEWCIFHSDGVWSLGQGVYLYSAIEYNDVSFNYHKPSLDGLFVCKKIN